MTFSIRSFLLGTGVVAAWLGALVSKSPLVVELAVSGTVLLILLSLALAIWDPRPMQRAFWTGFFVLAFGNLVYAGFFAAYQQTSNQVAGLIMGSPVPMNYQTGAYTTAPGYRTPVVYPAQQVSYYAPGDDVDEAPQLKAPPVDLSSEDIQVESSNSYPATAPTPPTSVTVTTGPYNSPPSAATYSPPGYPVPGPTAYLAQPANPASIGNYYEQREAIRVAVPTLMSLLLGLVGGMVTTWISNRRQPENA